MGNLRKILAMVLSMSIMLGNVCLSENILDENSINPRVYTEVSVDFGEVQTSYTIVVPSKVSIDPDIGETQMDVKLLNGFGIAEPASSLKVDIKLTGSVMRYEQGWSLYLSDFYGKSIPSFVSYDNWEEESTLIHVTNESDNSVDYVKTIYLVLGDERPSFGTYFANIGFSVTVE